MKIVAGSALQLEQETVKNLGLNVVEYPMYLNGDDYPVSMAMSREEKDILRMLLKDKNNKVTTSGLREQDLKKAYLACGGDKIISIHQAGKASTATSAMINRVLSENPELDVTFIDSHHLTAAYTVIVQQAAEAAAGGMAFDELKEYIEIIRDNTRHLGCVYDLFYLHRTGRLGLAKAIMGSAMKIIALLSSSGDPGVLVSIGKVKNSIQANTRFVNMVKEDMEKKNGKRVRCVISVIGPHEKEAQDLKSKLEALDFPVQAEIHYTNHSNMPHAGPDFYDLGYTIHA
ncbi:MAG: DegV family EDD domain-containing protein [Spirochaetales bacterium]|nr:DegV family EDD domain-containing protein [Spirochaetales bacterium]